MLANQQDARTYSTSIPLKRTAFERLDEFMTEWREGKRESKPNELLEFEKQLHEKVMTIERELVAEELANANVDAAAIEIEGVVYSKVLRSVGAYQTAAGEVKVERKPLQESFEGSRGRALDRANGASTGSDRKALDTACSSTGSMGGNAFDTWAE